MKKIVCVLLFVCITVTVKASNVKPTAVLNETPNQTWFYNLEDVVFNSLSSYDIDGYIVRSDWYINGVYQTYTPYTGNYNKCFALHGSPANGCYQLASGFTTVTVGLKVQDNQGSWSDMVTITYTIQEHKGRKYFVKDHIGNVRATVNRDGNVLGYDDYYPFGLVMTGRSNNTSNPNDLYKFTGHERDDEAGLTIDFMNARTYDPILGRFNQIDPLSDQFAGWTPYHYVHNNPLNLIDPTGMSAEGGEECIPCLLGWVNATAERAKDGDMDTEQLKQETETAVKMQVTVGSTLYSPVSTAVGIGFELAFSGDDADASGAAVRAATAEGITQLVPSKYKLPGRLVGAITGEILGGAGDRAISGEQVFDAQQISIDALSGFTGGAGSNIFKVAKQDATFEAGFQRLLASGAKKTIRSVSESGATSSGANAFFNKVKDWIFGDDD